MQLVRDLGGLPHLIDEIFDRLGTPPLIDQHIKLNASKCKYELLRMSCTQD